MQVVLDRRCSLRARWLKSFCVVRTSPRPDDPRTAYSHRCAKAHQHAQRLIHKAHVAH